MSLSRAASVPTVCKLSPFSSKPCLRPEPLKEATQGGGIVACVSGVGIYVSSYTQWVVWLRLLVRLLVSGRGLGLAGGVPPLNN